VSKQASKSFEVFPLAGRGWRDEWMRHESTTSLGTNTPTFPHRGALSYSIPIPCLVRRQTEQQRRRKSSAYRARSLAFWGYREVSTRFNN
jgi:hypothetical protein